MSPTELMNILNKIISKRKICFHLSYFRLQCFFQLHISVCAVLYVYSLSVSLSACVSDADLKTDGFSIESCRSMVAVMDVSFQ